MNPWLIVGALVALIAAGGGGYLYGEHVGKLTEHDAAITRDNKELTTANAKILTLEQEARATEGRHAAALAKIADDHQQEIIDAEIQRQNDVAAARAGRIVLRIPTPCERPDGGSAAGTPAAPGVGDGAKTTGLPRQITEDLLVLVDDANSVVRQLGECQKVVIDDRKKK